LVYAYAGIAVWQGCGDYVESIQVVVHYTYEYEPQLH